MKKNKIPTRKYYENAKKGGITSSQENRRFEQKVAFERWKNFTQIEWYETLFRDEYVTTGLIDLQIQCYAGADWCWL